MARQAAGGLHASYSARGSRAGAPVQPRGASPAGGWYHSRGSSPAPIGRAPLPGEAGGALLHTRVPLGLDQCGQRAVQHTLQGGTCFPVPPMLVVCPLASLQARRRGHGRQRCPAPAPAPPLPAALTPPSMSGPSVTGSARWRRGWTKCGARRACSRPAHRGAAAWLARGRRQCPAHVGCGLQWLGQKRSCLAFVAASHCICMSRSAEYMRGSQSAAGEANIAAHSLPYPATWGPISAGHSTPQRSRVPSRDPAADRARMAADCGRPARGSDPRGRSAAVSSTERLRAAVSTTPCAAGARALPPREQRATSPGRALHEVRERLQQYAQKPPRSSNLPGQRRALPACRLGHGTQASPVGEAAAAAAQRQHVPAAGVQYGDASAEIADIDRRLQSLQNFLRLAKAGQPVAVPS